MPAAAAETLREAGYNVSQGTYGVPARVAPSDGYGYVSGNAKLPNGSEQEVVVIDLKEKNPVDRDLGKAPPGETVVWQKRSSGVIDPRPMAMYYAAELMDRILDHGGIFVFFLDPPSQPEYAIGQVRYSNLSVASEPNWSTWSGLSVLGHVSRNIDYGQEVDVAERAIPELARHLEESSFSVTINPDYTLEERWGVLARNKYGQTIAAVISPSEDSTEGWVFLLPRVPQRGELLKALLDHLFPILCPKLFPHAESKAWIDRAEYQQRRVLELQDQIKAVEQENDKRIAELRDQMRAERVKYGYLQNILTTTGEDLVEAVITTLKSLGFKDVRNADEEPDEEGASQNGEGQHEERKREDIQIHDRSPLVLAEVKGIRNLPQEAGSLQVTKYLAPRMRQLDRLDIRGLSIINHQRSLPPLDRERENIFQADVIANAEDQGFGLLTTFDLYRLARGFLRHDWCHEEVADLFYQDGRIDPVPAHYEFVGLVADYWEQAGALAIQLEHELSVGDRVAYELPLDFEEENVESIHLDDEPVELAEAGKRIGVKTSLSKAQARKNVNVYRVRRP